MSELRRGGSTLLSQAVRAVWGWRAELVLGMIGQVAVILAVKVFGPAGTLLAGVAGGILLWRVPGLRRYLAGVLAFASFRRWWRRVAVVCGLEGPHGNLAELRAAEPVMSGKHLVIRVPIGMDPERFAAKANTLAAALCVREVRIARRRENAGLADVLVASRDPLGVDGVVHLAAPRAGASSLWNPVELGLDEWGSPVRVTLAEHNILLGGEPGAGKSAVLSLVVATAVADPECGLSLLDGKQVELGMWSGCATNFVGPDVGAAVALLGELCAEMDERYASLLVRRLRKVDRTCGIGLHVVVIDELAFYLRGAKSSERSEFAELLRDLVSRGRAAGIIVAAATQKPSHEVVPTWIRDLFSYRMALRCTTAEASDTVLGAGWASQGYSAATIDPGARGVGYLLAEGGVPRRMRSYYLDDARIENLARTAGAARRAAGGEA